MPKNACPDCIDLVRRAQAEHAVELKNMEADRDYWRLRYQLEREAFLLRKPIHLVPRDPR